MATVRIIPHASLLLLMVTSCATPDAISNNRSSSQAASSPAQQEFTQPSLEPLGNRETTTQAVSQAKDELEEENAPSSSKSSPPIQSLW